MGIRGLTAYITNNCWGCLKSYELQNTDLVLDGMNVCCKLYEQVDKQFGLMGGQYDILYESIKNFFETLQLCNIRPIVILDGIQALNKEQYITRFKDIVEREVPGESCAIPYLVDVVFIDVLRNLGIPFVQTLTEADETMAAIAKALDCPILSQDGDFYLYPTKFINTSTLDLTPRARGEGVSKQFFLSCEMYSVKNFCRRFKDIDESLLPLALVILGNKYGRSHLDSDIMKSFNERIDAEFSSKINNYYQKRIEKTLEWLSNYSSLNAAIEALLNWVDMKHRSKISDDIEEFIRGVSVCSPLAFRALRLSEEVIAKIREENDKRASMFPGVEVQNVKAFDDNCQYTEQNLIAMTPEWYIDYFARGKVCGSPLQYLMFSAALFRPLTDNPDYPPSGIFSLPILTSIYSIMCTLRDNDENVLEVYTVRGKDKEIIREEITVKTSSINFRDIDKLELSEKKPIINGVLGIKGISSLQELPSCWRLYTATIIFWMRHNVSPQSTRVHLFSVILGMILGVIDEKIGVIRSMEDFSRKYGQHYEDIKSRPYLQLKRDSSLRRALSSVTKEECIAAAPYFVSHFEAGPPGKDWRTVVHIFTQLHSCLRNSLILNSLLRYPYHPVPLHTVYNGLFLYNIFERLSKQEDIDSYLYDKLKYSPTIVEIFMILKNKILNMIEGK